MMIFLFLCAMLPCSGATGEIEFLRYEHNKIVGGRKCLSLHFRVNVKGLKGEIIEVIAYFESPKGKGVPDKNGKYSTKKGMVCVSETDDATYESTRWNNFTLNIPVDELHALPGKNTYYVEALLWHKNTVLARTYCDTFIMTGATKKSEDRSSHSGHSHGSVYMTKKWVENSSKYGFVEVKLYSNGMKKNSFYGLCPNCRGTSLCGMCYGMGVCSFCSGQGGRFLAAAGYWNPCGLCNGTGRCSNCKNNGGKCTLCNGSLGHEHPGFVCNAVQTIFRDGNSINEKVGYQWVSDRWEESRKAEARKKSCSVCHGTGVNPHASSGQPNHEWIADYIERGQQCPYCNSVGSHWHSRCSNCNVPTHY